MKKARLFTLIGLIALTIIVALLSAHIKESKAILFILLLVSGIKFTLVVFQFMDLRKANVFWKVLISLYLLIFLSIILTVS